MQKFIKEFNVIFLLCDFARNLIQEEFGNGKWAVIVDFTKKC